MSDKNFTTAFETKLNSLSVSKSYTLTLTSESTSPIAKTIIGLTTADIVMLSGADLLFTTCEVSAVITAGTNYKFCRKQPGTSTVLNISITKAESGGTL